MSWQAYIDNMKKYPGVNAGAIGAQATGQLYAQDGVNVTPAEFLQLVAVMNSPPDKREPSVMVGGQKYLVLRADDSGIDGKMKARCVSVRKSATLIVIALHLASDDEASDQSMGQKVVGASVAISDYLKTSNL